MERRVAELREVLRARIERDAREADAVPEQVERTGMFTRLLLGMPRSAWSLGLFLGVFVEEML